MSAAIQVSQEAMRICRHGRQVAVEVAVTLHGMIAFSDGGLRLAMPPLQFTAW